MTVRVKSADASWDHLWPPFRVCLEATFRDCEAAGLYLRMTEGYRSPARQLWLYGQGRTRPGKIVTYRKDPKFHGAGLAGDCYPRKGRSVVFAFTTDQLRTYRTAQARHGIGPTAMRGDLGHTELKLSGAELRKARAWCESGFPPLAEPTPERIPLTLYIETNEIPDAAAYLEAGASFAWVRAMLEDLELRVAIDGEQCVLTRYDQTLTLPCRVEGGRAFIRCAGLRGFRDLTVEYDEETRSVKVST